MASRLFNLIPFAWKVPGVRKKLRISWRNWPSGWIAGEEQVSRRGELLMNGFLIRARRRDDLWWESQKMSRQSFLTRPCIVQNARGWCLESLLNWAVM